jgi:hypothetical protein
MARFLSVVTALAVCLSFSGCSLIPGMGGGGGGGYKPTECMNTQFTGDLSAAKEGQWVTYVMDAGASKITNTVKIVGKDGGNWWVEHWMDMGSMAYGYLFVVGSDKKISKAWAAPKDGKEWTEITVKEPPKAGPAQDGPKPTIKESDEKKEVKAGSFSCHKLDVTVNVQGKDYNSQTWYSKDAWKIYMGSEHGGLVAMEASGSKTTFDSKGEDAKPTIELPKK